MDATYIFLQQYWWFLVSLLGALLVFLLFVQGGNSVITYIGTYEEERTMLVNSTGRKWEFPFTTLVTFRRVFLCFFPIVLQHQFRRCLLVMDDHSVQLRIAAVSYNSIPSWEICWASVPISVFWF